MEDALDVGIVTMGGGGDFSTKCDVFSDCPVWKRMSNFDDAIHGQKQLGEYLMTFINAEKMPRKLKVLLF